MLIEIDDHWRVRATHTIHLPMSVEAVWGQMRDFQRFITWDPLHRAVHVQDDQPVLRDGESPRGIRLLIEHRLLGIGPDRLSRILWWKEGRGYAFSDVSKRGRLKGFPHICMYTLEGVDARSCRLTVSARGRWTARFVPRRAAKLWLGWVLVTIGFLIGQRLAEYRLAVQHHARSV